MKNKKVGGGKGGGSCEESFVFMVGGLSLKIICLITGFPLYSQQKIEEASEAH